MSVIVAIFAAAAGSAVSAPDYATRAIVFGVIAFVGVAALAAFFRQKLVEAKRRSQGFHYFSELGEFILAISISVVVGFFELYKQVTWTTPKPGLVGSFSLWCGLVAIYLVVKWVAAVAKKRDADRIVELDRDLVAQTKKVSLLTRQRNSWVSLSSHVRKIIDKKMQRLVKVFKKGGELSAADLLSALDPKAQLQLIIASLFQYFEGKKEPDKKLRLAIYIRDPEDTNRLKRIYGWNGETSDCFSNRVAEIGRLNDPEGIKSQLVKCYHSPEGLLILESCAKAAQTGDFRFFPGQDAYLKSMVIYKHVYEHDGEKDALLLTLDSSQEYLFRQDDEEEIRTFLLEMMKRIEYEFTILTAQSRTGR